MSLGRWAISGLMVASVMVLGACTASPEPSPSNPTPSESTEVSRLPDVAAPLPLGELAAFSGVARMEAGSNCTGTLIDTGVPDGPAYILTNGHCVGDVGRSRQATTLAEPWFGIAEFFRTEESLDSTLSIDVIELAYSTMRLTDTAVLRLDATLGELAELGVRALPLAEEEPEMGAAVVNIGVPVQDLDHDAWVLRRGGCTLGEQHTVLEFGWLWRDVWANDCPGIIQGSSGSPLIELGPDGAPVRVVGVINTTSWGVTAADGGACFINRPCQVTAEEVVMVEETSYAQSVAGLSSCFATDTGEFVLAAPCPLPVSSVWAASGGGAFRGGDLPDAVGRTPEALLVGREAGEVRTSLVSLGEATACEDPLTYADAEPRPLIQATDEWSLDGTSVAVTLPGEEGWYALCAVSGDDYAGAATVVFEVDTTPPVDDAGAVLTAEPGSGVSVLPRLNPPEISTVRFTWGAEGTVDCADTGIFQDFFVIPLWLEIAELPATYCVYGMDEAGNRTPVVEVPIPMP